MNTSAVFRSRFRRHFWLYVIAAVASLGGLLAGFDMGVISGALLFINDTWNMSDFTKGWVVSSAIVGAVIGAAGNGFLSDIYGRKKVIIATALIFAVGSVICAAAPSIGWLIAGRVILGLAVGMVNFVIPLYLSEISPQKVRGMLVSLYQLAITAGILFSYLINRVFALSEYNWRWMLLSGLFPALVMLIGISFLGDTPRWLISKKREDEARRIFLDIDPDCNPEQQIKEIRQTIKRAQKNDGHSGFQRWMLMPVFVGVGMMFMQICTGINTIIYYTVRAGGFFLVCRRAWRQSQMDGCWQRGCIYRLFRLFSRPHRLDCRFRDSAAENPRPCHEHLHRCQHGVQLRCRSYISAADKFRRRSANFLDVRHYRHLLPVFYLPVSARNQRTLAGADRKELGRRRPCPQVLRIPLFKGSVPGTFFIFGRTVLC